MALAFSLQYPSRKLKSYYGSSSYLYKCSRCGQKQDPRIRDVPSGSDFIREHWAWASHPFSLVPLTHTTSLSPQPLLLCLLTLMSQEILHSPFVSSVVFALSLRGKVPWPIIVPLTIPTPWSAIHKPCEETSKSAGSENQTLLKYSEIIEHLNTSIFQSKISASSYSLYLTMASKHKWASALRPKCSFQCNWYAWNGQHWLKRKNVGHGYRYNRLHRSTEFWIC